MLSCIFSEFNALLGKRLPKSSLTLLFRASNRIKCRPVTVENILSRHLSVHIPTWRLRPDLARTCLLPSWSRRSVGTQSAYSLNEEDDIETSKKILFVGGLSPEISEDVVHNYFSSFAGVENVKMVKTLGGKQKQFCFVKLKDAESVDRVLKMEHMLEEKPLLVFRTKKHRVVVVDKLPSSVTARQLADHFSRFGYVEKVEIPEDRRMMMRKGYSFVTFSTQDEAAKIVEQGYHEIGSYELKVKFPGTHGEDICTPKVMVDNLPFETTVEELKQMFAQFGGLKVIDLAIRNDSNKCAAFLTFHNDEVVNKLIRMQDFLVGGSTVAMKKEIPNPKVRARLRSIHVGNVPANVTEMELVDYFSRFGRVYKVVLPLDGQSGCNRRFAVVKYQQRDSIERVMAQPQHVVGNTDVLVRRLSLTLSSHS